MNEPNIESPRKGTKKRTFILNKLQENYESNLRIKAKSSMDLINIQKVICTPKNSEGYNNNDNLASPAIEVNSSIDMNKSKAVKKLDMIRQPSKPKNEVKIEVRKETSKLEIKMEDKKKKAKCFLFKCFG
jgi:hypothetical protein